MTWMRGPDRRRLLDELQRFTTRTWRLTLLRGVIMLALGLVILLAPLTSVVAVVALLGALAVVDGVVALVVGLRARGAAGSGWRLAQGVVSILLGLLLMWQPEVLLVSLAALAGVALVVVGVGMAVIAAQTRRMGPATWRWQVWAGVLLALVGAVLLAFPATSVATVAVLVGLAACAAGVVGLVHGARLRRTAKDLQNH
jgi:uncharacterized membrane protein HdeD (DUF308 family)